VALTLINDKGENRSTEERLDAAYPAERLAGSQPGNQLDFTLRDWF
jgi:hypothetical protein